MTRPVEPAAVKLEDVIARIPGWARAGRIATTELHGGITNRNYRVDVDGEPFVVRIGGAGAELLGIDRAQECACNRAAWRVGVAPEVVHVLPELGVLVTRFLAGRQLTAEDLRREPILRRAVQTVRRIHDGPAFPGSFSAFRTVESYVAVARRHGVALPQNIETLLRRAAEIERAMRATRAEPRSCHNDLLAANFIDDGEVVRVIDWEYAGMGEPFFDLGNFAVNQELSDEQEEVLLEVYFGRVSEGLLARLRLMRIMSDLREAMWGMVQTGISRLDFDFPAYGRKHFERCTAAVESAGFAAWLRLASRPPG